MTTKDKDQPQPETDFAAVHTDCPFSGQGGSYIVENGVRRLVERTGLDAEGIAKANAEADAQRNLKAKE